MTIALLLFFISVSSIFLSEVFNYYNRLELSYFLCLLAPFFLYLSVKVEKKKIEIPYKETIIYFLFVALSIISTLRSVDIEISIKSMLMYMSGYFFFIFSFNYSKRLEGYFKRFLTLISLFSCLVFFVNNIFHMDLFKYGISLFYNYGHYQIGNLLVIGLLSIFPNPLSILFFIFILFSYSRTAHLSLMAILILQLFKNKLDKKAALIGGAIVIVSLIFIVFKTNFHYRIDKQLVSGRNVYFSYALSSIKELPLFGLGPGNYPYAVFKKQINRGAYADQADNIILQVLSENGILAGAFFVLFIFLVFYKRKDNVYFLMFLALTLMFMSDLSYRFNFFLILWFILGGLTLRSDERKAVNPLLPMTVFFIMVQILLLSQILLKQGFLKQSILIYPFQKSAYKAVIEENIRNKNKKEALYYLERFDHIFGRSTAVFQEINYYKAFNEKDKIASLYEKTLWYRTFIDVDMLKEALYFYKGFYGDIKGTQKMAEILKKIKSSYSESEKTSSIYMRINNFCLKTDIGC